MDSPYEKHLRAALTSGGISTGAIYRLAFELCRDLDPGGTLLDLGAGTGNLIRQLIEEGHRGPITGADIQAKPNTLPAGVHWIQADLNEAIPVPDASFDTIVSTEVLLALENPRFVFRELFRVLRPGGTLIVTIPNQESIRSLVSLGLGGHFAAFAITAIRCTSRRSCTRTCGGCAARPVSPNRNFITRTKAVCPNCPRFAGNTSASVCSRDGSLATTSPCAPANRKGSLREWL